MSGSDRPDGPPGQASGPDLRLLPLVGPFWIGLAIVLLAQPAQPLGVGLAGAAVIAAVLGLAGARARGRHRTVGAGAGAGAARVRWWVVLLGLGLGLVVGGLQVARVHPPVVDQVVSQSAVVVVAARVSSDPAVHWPADDGGRVEDPRWTVRAQVQRLTARGRTHRLSVPVILRGDSVRPLAFGAHVVLTGRAGASWSPESSAMAITVLGPVRVRAPPGALARATTSIRAGFREATTGLPSDAAALLLGLAVGDESLVGPDLDRAMIRSGLAHLTAVSGSNTALVVGLALGLAAALGWGWRVRIAWSVLVLAGYVALVRPQPSVLRAAGMGLVALLALGAGGRRRGPPALLASVVVLLVGWPEFALSLGFGLSVAATAGLLLVGPSIAERLGRWPASRWAPEPIRVALSVAAAAHLATLPLSVLMGNGASLVALPANVVVTPLVPVATVLGLAAALVAPGAPAVAALLAHVSAPATGAIAWIAHQSAAVPQGVLAVPAGPAPAGATAAVLAVAAVLARWRWRPWRDPRVLVVGCLLIGVGLVLRAMADRQWPPPGWIVLACDVGQGDGLIVRRPGATDALVVDVGPGDGGMAACVRDAGVRPAAVLLTHFHADHVDGLASVLARWDVPVLLTSPLAEPPDTTAQVLSVAKDRGVPLHTLSGEDRLEVAGLRLHVLWPARRMAASPANNASVVAVAEVPAAEPPTRVLLTGDIEPEAQAVVMAQPAGPIDIVKVPHHGSRYQLAGFAAWAGARIALVTVGRDNDYGHPSPTTLAQYRQAGALVGRTDEQGALAVLDGAAGPRLVTRR
jgi:competence protein ComEC